MERWEYKIVSSADVQASGSKGPMFSFRLHAEVWPNRAAIDSYLNGLGSEGWEIVAMSFDEEGESFTGLAKRPCR